MRIINYMEEILGPAIIDKEGKKSFLTKSCTEKQEQMIKNRMMKIMENTQGIAEFTDHPGIYRTNRMKKVLIEDFLFNYGPTVIGG